MLKNDYRELLQHEEDLLDIPLEDGRNGRDGRRELSADHQFAAEYMETTYAKSQEVNDRRMRKLWVRPEDPASTKFYACFSYPHVLSASSVLDSDEALEERLKVFDTKLFKSTEMTTQMGRWQANGERWHAVGEVAGSGRWLGCAELRALTRKQHYWRNSKRRANGSLAARPGSDGRGIFGLCENRQNSRKFWTESSKISTNFA